MRMATVLLSLAAALPVTTLPAAAAERSPLGQWARGDGEAKVRLVPCGADICAINTWIRDADSSEKVGDKLVMKLRQQAPAVMTGTAFDPQRDLTYKFEMRYADRTMTTRGCILGGLLCKGVDWTRID